MNRIHPQRTRKGGEGCDEEEDEEEDDVVRVWWEGRPYAVSGTDYSTSVRELVARTREAIVVVRQGKGKGGGGGDDEGPPPPEEGSLLLAWGGRRLVPRSAPASSLILEISALGGDDDEDEKNEEEGGEVEEKTPRLVLRRRRGDRVADGIVRALRSGSAAEVEAAAEAARAGGRTCWGMDRVHDIIEAAILADDDRRWWTPSNDGSWRWLSSTLVLPAVQEAVLTVGRLWRLRDHLLVRGGAEGGAEEELRVRSVEATRLASLARFLAAVPSGLLRSSLSQADVDMSRLVTDLCRLVETIVHAAHAAHASGGLGGRRRQQAAEGRRTTGGVDDLVETATAFYRVYSSTSASTSASASASAAAEALWNVLATAWDIDNAVEAGECPCWGCRRHPPAAAEGVGMGVGMGVGVTPFSALLSSSMVLSTAGPNMMENGEFMLHDADQLITNWGFAEEEEDEVGNDFPDDADDDEEDDMGYDHDDEDDVLPPPPLLTHPLLPSSSSSNDNANANAPHRNRMMPSSSSSSDHPPLHHRGAFFMMVSGGGGGGGGGGGVGVGGGGGSVHLVVPSTHEHEHEHEHEDEHEHEEARADRIRTLIDHPGAVGGGGGGHGLMWAEVVFGGGGRWSMMSSASDMLSVRVDRSDILVSTFRCLDALAGTRALADWAASSAPRVTVKFAGESGYGDGVLRDWVSEVLGALYAPEAGLFRMVEPSVVHPQGGGGCDDMDARLAAVATAPKWGWLAGFVTGIAARARVPTGFHLSDAFAGMVLGRRSAADALLMRAVQQVDPDVARTCRAILAAPDAAAVDAMGLTFEYADRPLLLLLDGEGGGASSNSPPLDVSLENRELFVRLVAARICGADDARGREACVAREFRRGFAMAMGGRHLLPARLRGTSVSEFNATVGGHIELQAHDVLSRVHFCMARGADRTRVNETVRAFRMHVSEMDDTARRRLLRFWTGSMVLPPLPAHSAAQSSPPPPPLQFLVRQDDDVRGAARRGGRRPYSHTCYNQLTVPMASTTAETMARLDEAIANCDVIVD